jgi:hypothetical protein
MTNPNTQTFSAYQKPRHAKQFRQRVRRGWLGPLLIVACSAANATDFEHTAALSFCALTGLVHAVCYDVVRNGDDIVALDLNCKLTRDIAGGGAIAMAETRRRVAAADDSDEETRFDAPHAFDTRYCAVNKGRYLMDAILGPVVVTFPRQPDGQSCARRAPAGGPIEL